jgi:hypothetical protein
MKAMPDVGKSALALRDSAARLVRALLHATFFASAALAAPTAHAQLLDNLEVHDGEGNASQVIVRFAAPVQFLRQTPLGSGRTLRVYIQVTGLGVQPSDLIPTTLRFPGSARVPPFSATFPDTGNALVLTFEREVRFSAGPGPDSRSIAVAVSVLRN